VSGELALSFAKIGGSVVLLTLVLAAAGVAARRYNLQPELGRKLVHVGLGIYCLFFPLIFSESWEVAATCALSVVVFMLARGAMKSRLGGGLHAVSRVSYGEILFAISVALLFELKDGHYVLLAEGRGFGAGVALYVVPLLILTLCDAAAAMVGANYAKRTFTVEDGIKSWEGVAVFILTAWLTSLIALLALSDLDRVDAVLVALFVALFGALLEAASWRGLDNLTIPVGLYFVLATIAGQGRVTLILATLAFVAVWAVMWSIGRRFSISRHWIATAAALLFCIAIFSGIDSVLTPAVAALAYGVAARSAVIARPPHDALNLLVTILIVALGFFLISDLMQRNTIFAFNLAFGCMTAGAVGRLTKGAAPLLVACVVGWCAMAVRTLLVAGVSDQTLVFAAVGAAAILMLGLAGRTIARAGDNRPWVTLGALCLASGLASMPLAPS